MHLCSSLRFIALLLVLQLCAISICYADKVVSESKLKAAYILNFARFVYWPEEAFEQSERVMYLCLYKKCPIEKSLRSMSNRTIQNKKISIRVVESVEGLKGCHVVFFSEKNDKENYPAIENLENQMVLTISDTPGFIEANGLIEFIRLDGKIRFKINVTRSKKNGIKYKTQLLEVAEAVR